MFRVSKRIVFGAGFLVVLGLIIFGVYSFLQAEPSCRDGIKNQGEEGIDCGFACGSTCLESLTPVEVSNIYLFKNIETETEKDYDVLFKIRNANMRFGASKIEYEMSLFDSKNNLFLRKRNFTYILPNQTKFVLEPAIRTTSVARRAEIKIISADWERLRGELNGEVEFQVRAKEYVADNKPGVFSRVKGTIFNASNFDFDLVDVAVVLFKNDLPLRATRTDLRTFLSQTERYFEADFVSPFSPIPDKVSVEITTNIFESFNFLKRYGTQEKFQRLY